MPNKKGQRKKPKKNVIESEGSEKTAALPTIEDYLMTLTDDQKEIIRKRIATLPDYLKYLSSVGECPAVSVESFARNFENRDVKVENYDPAILRYVPKIGGFSPNIQDYDPGIVSTTPLPKIGGFSPNIADYDPGIISATPAKIGGSFPKAENFLGKFFPKVFPNITNTVPLPSSFNIGKFFPKVEVVDKTKSPQGRVEASKGLNDHFVYKSFSLDFFSRSILSSCYNFL